MTNEVKKTVHGTPGTNAFFNLIVLGLPYLWLRLYRRFFAVYGLVAILLVAVATTVLPVTMLSLISILIAVGSTIDVYSQTKMMNNGDIAFPEKNKVLHGLGYGILIALVAFAVFGDFFVSSTPNQKSPFQDFLEDRKQQSRENQIEANFQTSRDAHCDAFKDDPRLVVGTYHANFSFTQYCYFKKAVETKDPSNCLGYHESLGFNDDCLGYVAYVNSDPSICAEMAPREILCESAYKYEKPLRYPCDASNMPPSIRDICVDEFEAFHKSLPVEHQAY